MEIEGYKAIVQYDPEIEMFRGEFVELNGGADFYGKDIDSLRKEGRISLKVFLDMCREDDVEPRKKFSGRFNVRIPPALHKDVVAVAAASGKSINQFIADLLEEAVHAH